MRQLDIPVLTHLSARLTNADAGDSLIRGRIEAYTCNRSGPEKELAESLDKQIEEMSKSPIYRSELSVSPFGSLVDSTPRRTFTTLISTLNAAFPDYDFSSVKPEQFTRENNLHMIVNYINTILSPVLTDYHDFGAKLWNVLDTEIRIRECEIYSYIPEPDADPFSDDSIWCFNYFFYNKKMKRVLFFTVKSVSKVDGSCELSSGDEEESSTRSSDWGWTMDMDTAMDVDDDGIIDFY